MKQLTKLAAMLMLLLAGCGFTACGDDDDDKKDTETTSPGSSSSDESEPGSGSDDAESGPGSISSPASAIVGTWRYDYSEDGYSGYEQYTFNADWTGTFRIVETHEGDTYVDTEGFTYTYAADGIVTVTWEDGEVVSGKAVISGDRLTIEDGEETYTYVRVS